MKFVFATFFANSAILIFASTTEASSLRRCAANLWQKSVLDAPSVDFQPEWVHDFGISADSTDGVPSQLRPPSFLTTFDFATTNTTNNCSGRRSLIEQLALQAKQNILHDSSGAILFRGLHGVLRNVSDFGAFWSAMNWDPVEHVSCYNRKRQRSANVDMVDTDVPWMVLGPHNEHACNPKQTGRIAFYGLQPATVTGGESLIRFNADIHVPEYVANFVMQHGGIQTTRIYADHGRMLQDGSRHPTAMSWQERCNAQSKQECVEFFAQRGMHNATFDDNDTLTVVSSHDGWLDNSWFNHVDYGFPTKCADGTDFPREWQMDMKRQKWGQTYAYKLQKGDWLIMDNRKVQHGRLPYQGDRQLVVTYTD